MKRTAWLALALIVAGLQAGCVTRRVMITSEPPGAVVYRNGQPIGATPVEEPFIYYGHYQYRLVKDGYQPLDLSPELVPPWFQYPGLDFIFENIVPLNFRDIQHVHGQLEPLLPVRPDDVKAAAENLRARGRAIQPPPEAQPRRRSQPAVPPAGPVIPAVPPPVVNGSPAPAAPSP
jgi:hypothetical protein